MQAQDLHALNNRFGIPGELAFSATTEGVLFAEVDNPLATAQITLQGAHVMTWTPTGESPVIWLSPAATPRPGKPIRGGVPICWPLFGPHDSEPTFPAHGFARTSQWQLLDSARTEDGATQLTLRLLQSDTSYVQWPHQTPLEIRITVGSTLEIAVTTHNLGPAPVTIGQALHAYFVVSDVSKVQVLGLEDKTYLDKAGVCKRVRQSGAVTIDTEVDRIYLDTTTDCIIDDPGLNRRIRIAKQGSASTVVWNPWIEKSARMGDLGGPTAYLGMLCVESANAADNHVTIVPGETHRLWARYSVETTGG